VAAIARAEECQSDLEAFLNTLEDLNSRLEIGLNYHDYTEKVGNVRVAYDKIDFGGLDPECVRLVGVPAEAALNQYIQAVNAWSKCIQDINCSNEQVKPTLQRHWAAATTKIMQARDGVETLRNGG